jgi:hypothetical protein
MSGSNGTNDGSLLLVICDTFASEICGTALRNLEDYGSADVAKESYCY